MLHALKALRADMGTSVFLGCILSSEFLDMKYVSLTLHYMAEGIDMGDIIAEHETPVKSVFRRAYKRERFQWLAK